VIRVDQTVDGIGNLVQLEQNARANAAGQGDSGGPIYRQNSDGKVAARGTITIGDGATQVPCTGYTAGGRLCFWRIWISDISWALSYFRAAVNT
jgi:secreted trypsin-like serine protease